ncbi:unannotated protein [freshwater metagenome]|uniref:Unannotated protein n=1 Tax=freshwater metagenome TaxID=449393 RepID=A0A6J7ULB3_9ZZZZ
MIPGGRDGQCVPARSQRDDPEAVAQFGTAVAAIVGVSEAELAYRIPAPALHRPVVEQRAHVEVAVPDCRRGASRAEVDGEQVVTHLASHITAIVRVAVAELSLGAVAPALDGVVVENGAGAPASRTDRFGGAPCAEVDRRKAVAHLAGVVPAVVRIAETKVRVSVVAPALDRVVVEEHTAVDASGAHDFGDASGAEVDGGEVVSHLAGVVAPVARVTEPQLAVVVLAPALDGVVVEDRAGVPHARIDGLGGASGAEVDGGEVVSHLAGVVTPVVGVPVAEFTNLVESPTLHRVVVEEGTRVISAGCQRKRGASGAEVDGGEVVSHFAGVDATAGGVSVPEFAVAIEAPALHASAVKDGACVMTAGDHCDRLRRLGSMSGVRQDQGRSSRNCKHCDSNTVNGDAHRREGTALGLGLGHVGR